MRKAQNQIEIQVKGMDCAGCVRTVESALCAVDGVESVEVLLSAEKAKVNTKNGSADRKELMKAVEDAGYRVPDDGTDIAGGEKQTEDLAKRSFRLFGLVFGGILLVVVAGEWLGLFQAVTENIPFWAGAIFVLATGYPVFRQVVVAALKKQVTPHALMALGALAALIAGEWVTAAIVVFFMRTGDFIEGYTADKARDSIRSLTELAPQTAIVIRDGKEEEVPVSQVKSGDTILVRPGGQIPVDGTVREGRATVDQSPITGESMPSEKTPGSTVYASTIAQGGRLKIKAEAIGKETTFGKIITMVEEAETRKGTVQRFADQFSAWYLPVVAFIALLTYVFRGDVMSTVAVMVVACSCAFALATPIALLATIGAGAKQGVLIKGGKFIEELSRADVLLIDKTGTLTFGKPEVEQILPLNGISKGELLSLAASAERYSEHPLGNAVLKAAENRFLNLQEPESFEELTGSGVRASVEGSTITVGNTRLISEKDVQQYSEQINELQKGGSTVMTVQRNGEIIGLLTARDSERAEAGKAIQRVRKLGYKQIELLTGDNEETAKAVADKMGVDYRAELLPEEKIEIVRDYQTRGHKVVMVGDGINDAPALAQADIGIAMGTTGTDVAIETADITLMRDDWTLVPELISKSYRTMGVIRGNFGFTTLYNIAGLTLAAFGFLPPILAAAAQSLPDVGILLNSSRLIKS
jgi:Cd2+/Zn2+-exporting ATPase/Cu+-exporting ATPase